MYTTMIIYLFLIGMCESFTFPVNIKNILTALSLNLLYLLCTGYSPTDPCPEHRFLTRDTHTPLPLSFPTATRACMCPSHPWGSIAARASACTSSLKAEWCACVCT